MSESNSNTDELQQRIRSVIIHSMVIYERFLHITNLAYSVKDTYGIKHT